MAKSVKHSSKSGVGDKKLTTVPHFGGSRRLQEDSNSNSNSIKFIEFEFKFKFKARDGMQVESHTLDRSRGRRISSDRTHILRVVPILKKAGVCSRCWCTLCDLKIGRTPCKQFRYNFYTSPYNFYTTLDNFYTISTQSADPLSGRACGTQPACRPAL